MFDNPQLVWLALCSCSLLALSAMVFAFALTKKLRLAQLQSETRLAHISHELAVTEAGAIGVGERLCQLEQRLRKDKPVAQVKPNQKSQVASEPLRDKKADRFRLINDDFIEPNYNQVEALLAEHKTMAEVLDDCDVSQAEVEMLSGLQQR